MPPSLHPSPLSTPIPAKPLLLDSQIHRCGWVTMVTEEALMQKWRDRSSRGGFYEPNILSPVLFVSMASKGRVLLQGLPLTQRSTLEVKRMLL